MPRKPRQLLDGGYYHVISRANNRKYILSEQADFETFKDLLNKAKIRYSWKLYHYCVMSNHFHLLMKMEIGTHLPKLMQYLLHEYSRYYRKKTGYIGCLWQGRYKSSLIEKESYMLQCGRYIERNPLRAGIVSTLEDYPWSSYRYYGFGQEDTLIDEDPYYQSFGATKEERKKFYQDVIMVDNPYDKLIDQNLLESHF